jgi:hypothetical protein
MATRTRKRWRPGNDGQFVCQVGWKIGPNGQRAQHKFRLGSDMEEARRRDGLLRQVWRSIEQSKCGDLSWTESTLEIAKQIAHGKTHLQISRKPSEEVVAYVQRVHQLRTTFPMLAILTEPEYGYAFGLQLLSALENMHRHSDERADHDREHYQERFRSELNNSPLPETGPTLHQALRRYIEWLRVEYQRPDDGVSQWGHTLIKQVESLIAHHEDCALTRLDHAAIETLIQYWRGRPFKRGTKQRVARKSAENYISALRGFFRWLPTVKEYGWRKPEGFMDIRTRVAVLPGEQRLQITPDRVFTLDELVLLYRYAAPLDQLLILLGLNCGFGTAESAQLTGGDIHLRTPHSKRNQEILNFESTEADSFIKFVRPKSGVYGEFILFSQTVQGIEWALKSRKQFAGFGPTARLLVNGRGEPYDKRTKGGNPNKQIPNLFARLLKRIVDDHNQMTQLPFKTLRKTGGDLVKRFSDGEIKGVFLCHGNPVTTDDLDDVYTTRPFGKVFRAIREVEQYLQPMFETAGTTPFRLRNGIQM